MLVLVLVGRKCGIQALRAAVLWVPHPSAWLGVAQPWWRGHVLLGRVTLRALGTAPLSTSTASCEAELELVINKLQKS